MQLKQASGKLRNEWVTASENQERYKGTQALQTQFEQWKGSARLAAEKQRELLRAFLATVACASLMTVPLDDEIAQLKRINQEHQCTVRILEQKYQFEALCGQSRPVDAAKKLLEIESSAGEHIQANDFLSNWFSGKSRLVVRTNV